MILLTLEMESGMLKSLPPCSLNPHGAGPSRRTLYESMSHISKGLENINLIVTQNSRKKKKHQACRRGAVPKGERMVACCRARSYNFAFFMQTTLPY